MRKVVLLIAWGVALLCRAEETASDVGNTGRFDFDRLLFKTGSADLDIEINFKGTPGEFSHRFEFFTDIKTQPKLHGVIVGRVADPSR